MNERKRHPNAIRNLFGIAAATLCAAFLLSDVASSEEALRVQAAAVEWADQHPGEDVPLIVQHDGTPDGLRTLVRDAGGDVEREFHIIPAFDVRVPPDALGDLAAHDDVNWVSLDAPVQSTGDDSLSTGSPSTAYPYSVKAPETWPKATGAGVTVALIDTGVSDDATEDFTSASGDLRVTWATPRRDLDKDEDGFGHGTHVGGIIAGRSTQTDPKGKYTGIAPQTHLLAIRVADDEGNATVGDLMAALEFVDDNRDAYNINVLNLSVTSSVAQSYKVDPIDAAVELLWFHGVTVVVAAGNDGDASDAVHYPPANDPFVITVGAFDDQSTSGLGDDALAPWSSRGQTQDGFAKPEVLGPGAGIVSPVSPDSYLARTYPEAIVDDSGNAAYFKMSGTSMATGAISGAVALVRQAHPEWTPGEVKYVLAETARDLGTIGRGALADKAVGYKGTPQSTDDGLTPSYILLAAAGVEEAEFEGVRWRDAEFEGVRWRGLELNGVRWRNVDWSGIRWRGVEWNGVRWGGVDFEGIRWHGVRWRGFIEN